MESSGLKEGDEVTVKLIEIDTKTGKYRLSMRALQPKPEGYVEPAERPRAPRRDNNNGDRPRRSFDDRRRNDGDRGPRRDNGDRPRRSFDGPRRNNNNNND
jgi:polyribonucleotide nucleotidyltransferase